MSTLQFQCQPGCTACCNQKGYVYLTEDDLLRAAAYVGMSAQAFEARYIYRTKNVLRFRKPRGSQCHFLKTDGCSIHPAKPTQCRTFPFWPELVQNRANWAWTARTCPGINQGELIQIGEALEIAQEMVRAFPSMYKGSPYAK
jgi:Fe-S-cluster containining protein